jgi:deoxyribodipyrimidine photo-lyase
MDKKPLTIFWFRRDLRLHDNAGLYRALKSGNPVLCLFIFDKDILDDLEDKDDARVTFIYNQIEQIDKDLQKHGSSLLLKYDKPEHAWKEIIKDYDVAAVYTNHDYEPYAKKRDADLGKFLAEHGIEFKTFKDQVILEGHEVVKDDRTPYTVFTPYKKKWLNNLTSFHLKSYPTEKYVEALYQTKPLKDISLKQMGFEESQAEFPPIEYKSVIEDYAKKRDFPAIKGTSHIALHLRFGTVSIRDLAREATQYHERTWLNELIWREFYMMSLDFFPQTINAAYRPEYDRIQWRNNQKEFEAWCEGNTGYPLVDAGMRELNATGFMHNRVRMVVASLLVKHLLIDWRWGEHYFARKLLDYDASANVGNWQWVAGSGTDTMPYFRIFNPESQLKKFDPKMEYIKKWVPEYGTSQYPKPIVDNTEARARCLKAYKQALGR